MQKVSISIVIPAYNEEGKLRQTVEETIVSAQEELTDYEIFIVNDGSQDGTRRIADQLANEYDKVSVIHHEVNKGVGAAYQNALFRANFDLISLVPGDNVFRQDSVSMVFKAARHAEMVISYRDNPQARTAIRRIFSKICTVLLRLVTRCPIRDGHSMYVWPVQKARLVHFPNDYRYHLVSLTCLMREVDSYTEVPVILTPRPDHSSGVMKFNIVLNLGLAVLKELVKSLLKPFTKKPKFISLSNDEM